MHACYADKLGSCNITWHQNPKAMPIETNSGYSSKEHDLETREKET